MRANTFLLVEKKLPPRAWNGQDDNLALAWQRQWRKDNPGSSRRDSYMAAIRAFEETPNLFAMQYKEWKASDAFQSADELLAKPKATGKMTGYPDQKGIVDWSKIRATQRPGALEPEVSPYADSAVTKLFKGDDPALGGKDAEGVKDAIANVLADEPKNTGDGIGDSEGNLVGGDYTTRRAGLLVSPGEEKEVLAKQGDKDRVGDAVRKAADGESDPNAYPGLIDPTWSGVPGQSKYLRGAPTDTQVTQGDKETIVDRIKKKAEAEKKKKEAYADPSVLDDAGPDDNSDGEVLSSPATTDAQKTQKLLDKIAALEKYQSDNELSNQARAQAQDDAEVGADIKRHQEIAKAEAERKAKADAIKAKAEARKSELAARREAMKQAWLHDDLSKITHADDLKKAKGKWSDREGTFSSSGPMRIAGEEPNLIKYLKGERINQDTGKWEQKKPVASKWKDPNKNKEGGRD
jgi:hypothetical protein